jgi:hypothetical protein
VRVAVRRGRGRRPRGTALPLRRDATTVWLGWRRGGATHLGSAPRRPA